VRALSAARKLLQTKNHDVEMSLRGVLRGFGLKVGPNNTANLCEPDPGTGRRPRHAVDDCRGASAMRVRPRLVASASTMRPSSGRPDGVLDDVETARQRGETRQAPE
jgi:hypothetical protein